MTCQCSIIPTDVLKRFAHDQKLSAPERKCFADAALIDAQMRKLRAQAVKLTNTTTPFGTVCG